MRQWWHAVHSRIVAWCLQPALRLLPCLMLMFLLGVPLLLLALLMFSLRRLLLLLLS